VSGNLLCGVLVSASANLLKVKSRAGEFSVGLNTVETINFYHSNLEYLSDMAPKEVKEIPFFDRFLYPYQKDRSLEKKAPISMRGNVYRKGVSVHSKTELKYELGGGYKRFVALIGIDDEAMGKGNVDFKVIVDGRTVYEKIGVTGRDAPTFIKIDLSGVKEMVLVVDFGEQLDILDRAVWADAALIK
ncbi:MAG: NPCBM/NEW2 domain-containing protein, partial [Planctomycetota bacterium]|nr:NPCBM/NEW2 domain-containing protein [Planctomycetota bacterium]